MRRGNVYHFRCSIPNDIKKSYPKAETFSLKTSDYQEALKKLRKASAEIDEHFEGHRRQLAKMSEPALPELSEDQIKHIEAVYFAHLLEEDSEVRLDGLSHEKFDARAEDIDLLDATAHYEYARGQASEFLSMKRRKCFHGQMSI